MNTAKRILLVDDDQDDQQLFCEALHQIHPQITCQVAHDGAEALELVSELPAFELIFLDLNMPKVDGFECLKHLRSHQFYKHVPIIILTTSDREQDKQRCMELGANTFFTKPSSYSSLFEKLKGILNQSMQSNGFRL